MPESPRRMRSPHFVAMRLKQAIVSGELEEGTKLPSTRQLAEQYRISKKTIGQVLAELRNEGLIDYGPRRSPVVRARHAAGRQVLVAVSSPDQIGEGMDGVAGGMSGPSWLGQILLAADQRLLREGYQPYRCLAPAEAEVETDRGLVEQAVHAGVAGAILVGGSRGSEVIAELLDARRIPWVTVKPLNDRTLHNYVTVDFFDAARTVGRLFAQSGRRQLAYFGRADTYHTIHIYAGLQLGCVEGGGSLAQVRHIDCGEISESGACRIMSQWLASGQSAEAVLTLGDYQAIGVMRACREQGLDVPESVGVVGMTGLAMSAYAHPPLSVVRQPMGRLGQEVAEALLACMKSESRRIMGNRIQAEVVLRRSFDVADALVNQLNARPGRTPVRRDG